MSTLARLLHRDEAPLTRPAALSARYPAPNLALDPRVRAVLETPRLGCEPGTSRAVIDELKAADRPAAPTPPRRPFSPDLLTRLAFVSTAMHADYARHLDTLRVLDELKAALAEHSEFLTSPECHPGPRLRLRRIAAELPPYIAETEEQKQAIALEQQYATWRAEDAALDTESGS